MGIMGLIVLLAVRLLYTPGTSWYMSCSSVLVARVDRVVSSHCCCPSCSPMLNIISRYPVMLFRYGRRISAIVFVSPWKVQYMNITFLVSQEHYGCSKGAFVYDHDDGLAIGSD